MRPEKTTIVEDLSARLNQSPFLIVTEYTGMNVLQFSELRSRLAGAGARCRSAADIDSCIFYAWRTLSKSMEQCQEFRQSVAKLDTITHSGRQFCWQYVNSFSKAPIQATFGTIRLARIARKKALS